MCNLIFHKPTVGYILTYIKESNFVKMNKLFFSLLTIILLPNLTHAVSRTWYQKAHVGGDARHRCTGFAIGNKGYYGGGHVNSGATINYKDYWEYDPATNSWTQIADFGGGLRYHSSAFVIDDAAYVGGGEDESSNYTADFWKYVPEVNTWFPISDFPGTPRRGGTAFTIDGIGYYGTGQSVEGYHFDFYSYNPLTDEWAPIADFIGEQRNATVSFVLNDKAYVGTGHIEGAAVNDFYEYDPATNVWTAKANVGGSIRQDAMAFAIDGKGYIGTGNDNEGTDFGDIWEYDPAADTWTQIEDFGGQKRRYAVTFVIENIAYLGGGTDGTNFKDFWAYAPTVSIIENELAKLELAIYPNPAIDIIYIKYPVMSAIQEKLNLSITDLSGRVIYQFNQWNGQLVLNKNEIGNGVYFANLSFDGQLFMSRKFIFTN